MPVGWVEKNPGLELCNLHVFKSRDDDEETDVSVIEANLY